MESNKKIGTKKIAAVCILENEYNEYLLLKRTKEPHLGYYLPVGGKVKLCEDPDTAVKREVLEETGIKIDNLKFYGILTETSPDEDYNWIIYFYHSYVKKSVPVECNEGILEWVPAVNTDNILLPDADTHIFNLIKEKKNFVIDAVYNDKIELLHLKDAFTDKVIYSKD